MVATIDSKTASRYQSIINLSGNSLSESLHKYFNNSEQVNISTKIKIFDKPEGILVRGIMIEKLPEISEASKEFTEDLWYKSKEFLSTVTNDELLLEPEEILYKLFHDDHIKIYSKTNIIYKCRCSREKMQKALDMINSQNNQPSKPHEKIVIKCEFCGNAEEFE